MRKRKNIYPASPAAFAAYGTNLTGTVESAVGGAGTFFLIIEQNKLQIFAQVEIIQFT
jgi:hypothetical protein